MIKGTKSFASILKDVDTYPLSSPQSSIAIQELMAILNKDTYFATGSYDWNLSNIEQSMSILGEVFLLASLKRIKISLSKHFKHLAPYIKRLNLECLTFERGMLENGDNEGINQFFSFFPDYIPPNLQRLEFINFNPFQNNIGITNFLTTLKQIPIQSLRISYRGFISYNFFPKSFTQFFQALPETFISHLAIEVDLGEGPLNIMIDELPHSKVTNLELRHLHIHEYNPVLSPLIIRLLTSNNKLTSVNILGCRFDSQTLSEMFTQLPNTRLKCFSFDWGDMKSTKKLIKILRNTQLEALSLDKTNLITKSAEIIGDGLMYSHISKCESESSKIKLIFDEGVQNNIRYYHDLYKSVNKALIYLPADVVNVLFSYVTTNPDLTPKRVFLPARDSLTSINKNQPPTVNDDYTHNYSRKKQKTAR